MIRLIQFTGPVVVATTMSLQAAAEMRNQFSAEVEGGAVFTARNEVRIPGDTGTPFSMRNLTDSGPAGYVRGHLNFDFNPRHQVRLTLAPLETSGVGALPTTVNFVGTTFAPGVPTRGEYQFNTWRLGYRWTFFENERWQLGLGGTAAIRDASVRLVQGATTAVDSNVGFVPLAHLYAQYRLGEKTRLVFDFEGLAAPQGRALDAALKVVYQFNSRWSGSLGYRTLEGGVDNDSTYNSAWFHFVAAGLRFDF